MKKKTKWLFNTSYEDRFWAKVQKTEGDGCWEWTAARFPSGYGCFGPYKNKRSIRAHRLSWILNRGEIPKDLLVLHKCDNPACVRPEHLFLGTNDDNVKDRVAKGRNSKLPRDRNPRVKLTNEDVEAILTWSEEGLSSYRIAQRLNHKVGDRHVRDILSGKYRPR